MANRSGITTSSSDHQSMAFDRKVALILLAIFLLFAVVVGGALSLIAVIRSKRAALERDRSRQAQRLETVAEVKAGSGHVSIAFDDAPLLEMLANDRACRENVASIVFFVTDLSDARYLRLREFANLRELSFYDCDHPDDVIDVASEMPRIERLYFEVTRVSEASLDKLANFPRLKSLEFEQVMPDATIDRLKERLPNVTIKASLESEAYSR